MPKNIYLRCYFMPRSRTRKIVQCYSTGKESARRKNINGTHFEKPTELKKKYNISLLDRFIRRKTRKSNEIDS